MDFSLVLICVTECYSRTTYVHTSRTTAVASPAAAAAADMRLVGCRLAVVSLILELVTVVVCQRSVQAENQGWKTKSEPRRLQEFDTEKQQEVRVCSEFLFLSDTSLSLLFHTSATQMKTLSKTRMESC